MTNVELQTVGNEHSETALVRKFFDLVNSDKFDEAIDLLSENVFYTTSLCRNWWAARTSGDSTRASVSDPG